MKKIFDKNVLYISKEMVNIDTTQQKFFPFLKSSLINQTANEEITIKNIHAMCNWDNVRNYIPHKNTPQQFVVFGRSNVGKSSLLNSLIRKQFVETSKKPGKTKDLAFLRVNFPYQTFLVDAPGYGYASDASKHDILHWGRLIEYYLKNTDGINDKQLILLLLDITHGLKDTDGMLIKMLKKYKKKYMLVYTKCDRAKESHYEQSLQLAKKMQENMSNMFNYVHYTSSRTGEGIKQLRNHILYRMATKYVIEKGEIKQQ